VVEGYIESELPAYVFLSKSQAFFDDTNNLSITNANVTIIRDDGEKRSLTHINQEIMDSISDYLNIDNIELPFYSIYIDLNPYFEEFNQTNHFYKLNIEINNKVITANTSILPKLDIDSVWCICGKDLSSLSNCYIWALINDPDTLGNIFYAQYRRYDGENIDKSLRICSRFLRRDNLWNGKSYPTYFSRSGVLINEDGNGGELPFYAKRIQDGKVLKEDKVILKISQISNQTYLFLRSKKMQEELYNNPFSEPINLIHNIEGGLGIWCGYGALYYDVIIKDSMVIYNSIKPDIADIFLIK
ncbi:MAG: DUF4249 family protein, partial [Pelagibacterales bacterium]|nr:DUF4249 family protein [Pelagibacterales bacterium]